MAVIKVTKDKARYNPGDTVTFTVVTDGNGSNVSGDVYSRETKLTTITQAVLGNSVTLSWVTPNTDYQGYHIDFTTSPNDTPIVIAVDVSSNSNKFIRYGSLTQFQPNQDNTSIINTMKDLNINNLEYYDAYYQPQQPFPSGNELSTYTQNWATYLNDSDPLKTKSGQTVKNSVDYGHQVGIDSMLYNMIYAFTGSNTDTNYLQSIGVDPTWILHNSDGTPFYNKAVDQTYLDISNPAVATWISNIMLKAINDLGFDGWHGDTIGDNGVKNVYDATGKTTNSYAVDTAYPTFANNVKAILGNKKFTINAVNGEGERPLSKSNEDFAYSETWKGIYYDLDQRIKILTFMSGRSLVIPGYLQQKLVQQDPTKQPNFNPNAVLLMDAIVYGAGGSRIEIVDGNNLLVTEYFPDKTLTVTPYLQQQIYNYYTFITAYENLLRDGQLDDNKVIKFLDSDIDDIAVSSQAVAGTVYAYSRNSANYQTVQIINMLGVNDEHWQDDDGAREDPIAMKNFRIKLYTSEIPDNVYLATPDEYKTNQTIPLTFYAKLDEDGSYLDIQVPYLHRWDMLYFKHKQS